MRILLGSKSPRRKELLSACNIVFDVVAIDCEETYDSNLNRYDVPVFLSQKKSKAYPIALGKNELLITSDTVVVHQNKILEKPKSREEAIAMLRSYSNTNHDVVTGVTLRTNEKTVSFSDIASVHFSELKKEEIEYYVDNFNPFDKAGAYGIQEYIGHIGIEKIVGTFNTVVGLPTQKLLRYLKDFN